MISWTLRVRTGEGRNLYLGRRTGRVEKRREEEKPPSTDMT